MANKVTVGFSKPEKLKQGYVLVRPEGSIYMVSCSHKHDNKTLYNLVNLETGGRYANPMTLGLLEAKVKANGFEIIGDADISINRKIIK